jgi:serine/threonine protein kinase
VTSPTALPHGFVINGRYEVLDKLGQGANGVVYQVRDHTQNMVVALKLIPVADPLTAWEEAHVLTGLRGQYMLPILNADLASGMPFIVTEIARHGSAADALRAGVGVSIDRAVRWVQQACRGTARVHDSGLVHTDIKPDNLFIDADGDALVADLGLACLRDANGRGHFAGTSPTMAPEVAGVVVTVPQSEWGLQRPTSVASDVYSLGATLYWLIAGRPPFEGADPIACMTAVAAGPPPSIRDLAPHVPQGLADRINRAMARDPQDRYANPAEFDAALGARPTQKRSWTRAVPHPGHKDCFHGTGKGADVVVCAVPTGKGTEYEIQSAYLNSGRAVGKPWRVARRGADLPQALRAAFRGLS